MEYELYYTDALRESGLFKEALSRMRGMEPDAADDKGVFVRLDGRKFARIYRRAKKLDGYFGREAYYVLDEGSGKWLLVDCRGRTGELRETGIPSWEFMDSHSSHGYRLLATKNTLLYPVEENPIPAGMEYTKGEIRHITPHIGDISALAGAVSSFFTIEGNGDFLCHYGESYVERSYYLREPTEKRYGPYFLNCLEGTDLPKSEGDDTVDQSQFKLVADGVENRYSPVQIRLPPPK
jgi:hypothetical protein